MPQSADLAERRLAPGGGAIAGGGSGAGKGAAIGGLIGVAAGTLYGLNENKRGTAGYESCVQHLHVPAWLLILPVTKGSPPRPKKKGQERVCSCPSSRVTVG